MLTWPEKIRFAIGLLPAIIVTPHALCHPYRISPLMPPQSFARDKWKGSQGA